jgi:hypothetical protein
MTSMAPALGHVVSGFIGPRYAEILVRRDNANQSRSGFNGHFVQNADGVWRILGM